MKILLVANKVPYPPNDGGAFATLNMALGLSRAGAKVTIAAISTPKHPTTNNDIPEHFKQQIRFESVFVNTNISSFRAFRNFIFSNLPYNAERFISNDFKRLIEDLIEEENYDIIQLEGLYLTPYIRSIRNKTKASVVLRAHNVEHEIWERTARNETHFFKRIYLTNLAKRIRRMEVSALGKIDCLIPISFRDERNLTNMGYRGISHTSPTGYQLMDSQTASEVIFPSLFHIGGLDWMPNREGLTWFLDNCWELIREVVPQAQFFVAGRNASKDFVEKLKSYPRLVFLGEVPDSKQFMSTKAVMVVPLLAGSGMRIKIVEGMSLGKAIVSTPIGAEGIEAQDGEEIMIANSVNEFVAKTVNLLLHRDICFAMGDKAKQFARQYLDNDKLTKELLDFFKANLIPQRQQSNSY